MLRLFISGLLITHSVSYAQQKSGIDLKSIYKELAEKSWGGISGQSLFMHWLDDAYTEKMLKYTDLVSAQQIATAHGFMINALHEKIWALLRESAPELFETEDKFMTALFDVEANFGKREASLIARYAIGRWQGPRDFVAKRLEAHEVMPYFTGVLRRVNKYSDPELEVLRPALVFDWKTNRDDKIAVTRLRHFASYSRQDIVPVEFVEEWAEEIYRSITDSFKLSPDQFNARLFSWDQENQAYDHRIPRSVYLSLLEKLDKTWANLNPEQKARSLAHFSSEIKFDGFLAPEIELYLKKFLVSILQSNNVDAQNLALVILSQNGRNRLSWTDEEKSRLDLILNGIKWKHPSQNFVTAYQERVLDHFDRKGYLTGPDLFAFIKRNESWITQGESGCSLIFRMFIKRKRP